MGVVMGIDALTGFNHTVSQAYFCFGLWPQVLCEITLRCHLSPHSQQSYPPARLFLLPVTIEAKYFPLVLLLLSALLGDPISASVGVGVGYASKGDI